MSQRSARPGATLRSSPRESRSSKMRLSMRSDWASRPTRGSRLVGLDSMIMTSVLGSGREEQEKSGRSSAAMAASNARSLHARLDWFAPIQRLGRDDNASRIGNLPEDGGALGAGGGGDVGRAAMPGLVGEHGEGDGFFGFRGQAEFVGEVQVNAERRELFGEKRYQSRVVRAAARENHLAKAGRAGKDEVFNGRGDGIGGQRGGCGDDIRLAGAGAAAAKFAHKFAAEFLAAGGFRWAGAKEFVAQKMIEHRRQNFSGGGNFSVAIERAAEQRMGEGVHNHVAGAGVESEQIGRLRAGGNGGEVGDAADVLHDASDFAVAKEEIVKVGDERRACAASGHVGGAKVGDDRNAQAGRDHGGFAGLPGGGDFL